MSPVAAHALARAAYKAGVPMWPGAAGDEVAARRRGTPESSAGGSGR